MCVLTLMPIVCYFINRTFVWYEDMKIAKYGKLQELEKVKYTAIAEDPGLKTEDGGAPAHWRKEEHSYQQREFYDTLEAFMVAADV